VTPNTPSPADLTGLRHAWNKFTQTGQLTEGLSPLVVVSWQRCAPRLNPNAPPQWAMLRDDVLALTLRQSRHLIAITRPILEDIYQMVEGAGMMLVLVDSTTCLVDFLGDEPVVAALADLGVRLGAFLHEGRTGSIAFSSALLDNSPVQFVGAEHFLGYFHGLSSAAAPIFNLDGHAVGAVGLLTTAERHNPYAAGLALAAARAIENQLQADLFTAEANARTTELNTTLDASSEGVLVWNADGVIMHLNLQAGKMLGLKPANVMGRPLREHLQLPKAVTESAARGEDITDLEASFEAGDGAHAFLVSLRTIRQLDGAPANHILMLRRLEQVHQLVHRLVGAQAHLTLDSLVGESAAARRVRRQAVAAADARACVLILGEAGTGKNVLARAIHNGSARANGPFLSINCRAVPRELALAEFLGFEAGAFNSGHPNGQPSKFELADGGTLFLDEVDALSLDMQAALLRVIEAGDVIRLGGNRVIPVNVRLIASSHTSLEGRVAEGSFRSDLLFRLSSFVITLPPLRDRMEDIAPLIQRLLMRLSKQLSRPIQLTAEAEAVLTTYPWPGNIRELESVLERVALLCDDEAIRLEHLPAAVRERRVIVPGRPVTEPVRSLVEAEKVAILHAARATGGNLTRTAQILGIGRTTLWRKIKELRISLDDFSVS
jgi:transcriptional activator for dhaKLM operon